MMKARKGQSTLEYVIILTAIIGVVIVFAGGVLKNKTKSSLEHVANEMDNQTQRITFGGN